MVYITITGNVGYETCLARSKDLLHWENGSIFSIEGEGKTHIRCWKSATGIHLLAAYFSHGGAERFLKSFTKRSDRPLKKGQTVTGSVTIGD
jgi:hypothetical protein